MIEALSLKDAQKLVLLAQKLPPTKQSGSAQAATLCAIEHLGYIQIDTISVVQRAHHHTLWNRNPRYIPEHLDQLVADKNVFEYWSHAAAYLPMCDYRFSLPRKLAIADRDQKHWYVRDEKLMQAVKQRITDEGPLMAKDFDDSKKASGHWKSKPSKRALESLYMQGDLMIPERLNFHKIYDLTERVLPSGTNTSAPSSREHIRFLICQYLRANGIGRASEIAYLLKNVKPLIASTLQDMVDNGELIKLNVQEHEYFATANALESLRQPLARSHLKILSPFDNLLIQRKRMQTLFQFDYLIECYVPEAKRKFGYFCLPILWQGVLSARMDCKTDHKTGTLHIHLLDIESTVKDLEAFAIALNKELREFMQFNDCDSLRIHKAPETIERLLTQSFQ